MQRTVPSIYLGKKISSHTERNRVGVWQMHFAKDTVS